MSEILLITYYEIVMGVYHGEPVGRVRYSKGEDVIESGIYTPKELNNILMMWRSGDLAGSFGIGGRLAYDAAFQICAE